METSDYLQEGVHTAVQSIRSCEYLQFLFENSVNKHEFKRK
jgi:hypothetical protein